MQNDQLVSIIQDIQSGKPVPRVATKHNYSRSELAQILSDAQKTVLTYKDQHKSDKDIAYELNLPLTQAKKVISFYETTKTVRSSKKGQPLKPRKIHTRKEPKRSRKIRDIKTIVENTIAKGFGTRKLIAEETNIPYSTVTQTLSQKNLSRRELQVHALNTLFEKGVRDWQTVIARTELTPREIRHIAREEKLFEKYQISEDEFTYAPAKLPREKKHKLFLDALQSGKGSYALIEEMTGLKRNEVKFFGQKEGFQNQTRLQLHTIRNHLSVGTRELETLCANTNMTPNSMRRIIKTNHLEDEFTFAYDELKSFGPNDVANSLIRQGAPLDDIATHAFDGKSRETARQYVLDSAQYQIWIDAKEQKIQNQQKNREHIVSVLYQKYIQEQIKDDPALEKTIEHIWKRKKSGDTLPTQQVYDVFQMYFTLVENKEPFTYKSLAKATGRKYEMCTKRILGRVDLKPVKKYD